MIRFNSRRYHTPTLNRVLVWASATVTMVITHTPCIIAKACMLACFHSPARSADQIAVLYPSCVVAFVDTNNKYISHIAEDNKVKIK